MRKRMDICMCDWVSLLYSRKLTEYCKPAVVEKIKIFKAKLKFVVGGKTLREHWVVFGELKPPDPDKLYITVPKKVKNLIGELFFVVFKTLHQ